MAELIEYVRTLADDIGPRPATTDAEHRAAEWLERSFSGHGLDVEVQEFSAPHSTTWAFVFCNVTSIACAFLAGYSQLPSWRVWPAFAVAAIATFFYWSELSGRWGLSRMLPHGPSQNVIARHIPRSRRGEKLRRVVIVAHYDSTRASLDHAPGFIAWAPRIVAAAKWSSLLVAASLLLMAMPFSNRFDPWLWYATLAFAAVLIVPAIIGIHRQLFMGLVEGANDNASGVAAMMGVMERLIPAPDANNLATGSFGAVRHSAGDVAAAGVLPDGVPVRYAPTDRDGEGAQIPDDFRWAEPVVATPHAQAVLDFDTVEFAILPDDPPTRIESSFEPARGVERTSERASGAPEVLDPAIAGYGAEEFAEVERGQRSGGGLLSRLFGRRRKAEREDVSDWLGVDGEFDARAAGREIGSWEKFSGDSDSDDEAGGLGWKGGWAGDDPIGDPDFAANEAARIRRRVTESVDRDLTEKEVWFVATGSKHSGAAGMRALLHDYPEDMREALIINIDSVGSGQLVWASTEGVVRRYRANARLVGLARRVSRETETVIKPKVCSGRTDVTVALAHGLKAITFSALGADGQPANRRWKTDVSAEIDGALVEKVADFVAEMVRQA